MLKTGPSTQAGFAVVLTAALLLPFGALPSQAFGSPPRPAQGSCVSHDLMVETVDRVLIKSTLYSAGNAKVIIYCHRALGSKDGPEVHRLLGAFLDRYDLITFDFRGHRSSFGVTTTGGEEILDLRAIIGLARTRGYKRVVVLGAGMGGSVGLRAAGTFGNIDALVVVSPSGFSPSVAPFFVRFVSDRALGTPYGKVPLRLLVNTRIGLRYAAGYPADMMPWVDTVPTLVLQAQKDRLVSLDRLQVVFEDLPQVGQLRITPGRKHAEDLLNETNIRTARAFLDSVLGGDDTGRRFRGPGSQAARYRPGQITLAGDTVLPEEIILRELEARLVSEHVPGRPVECSRRELLQILRDILAFHGYTRASLTTTDSLPGITVGISIPRVHSVSIEDARWVEEAYVSRTLDLGEDYFNAYELDGAIRRVAAEPSIRTVRSSIIERPDGDLDIRVTVVEERPYRFLLATKFTEIDDFVGMGFTWNEFNPTGLRYHGEAMLGVNEYDFLTRHRLGKSLLGGSLEFGIAYFDIVKSRDDLEYVFTRQGVHEIGGEFTARYRFSSSIAAEMSMVGKKCKSPVITTGMPVEEGRAGSVGLRLDLKGRLPRHRAPRFEWRHTFYYQATGPWDIGDFDYDLYQLNFQGDLSVFGHHRISSSLHGGWLNGGAPPQDRFSLGGMTTLPGYADDAFVGPRFLLAGQSVYLSASSIVEETSVWHPLRLRLYFDAGTVWDKDEKFRIDALRMDTGFELDYMEILRAGMVWPVGPLREGSPRGYVGWGIHVLW
jgi:pimeloyl-ACP methyl ester carboxylesterase